MTETASPQTARETARAAYSDAYIEANRLQYNDVDEQNDGDGVGYWYVEIDMATKDSNLPGCACGCGFAVTSAKRKFIPGHDQRLMGILIRAHREGMEVAWTTGGMLISADPANFAQHVLSDIGQAKLARYIANEPKRTRRSRTTAALATAEVADGQEIPTLSDEPVSIEGAEQITVKIGRWEKEALVTERDQDGAPFEVQYNDAKGNPVITTKFKLV